MSHLSQDLTGRDEVGAVRRVARAHPLIAFIVLAYLISWAAIPLLGDPLGSGPFLAAVIVLAITKGRPGIRALFRQMTKWRVNWKWYAAAIGLPAAAAILAAVATVGLGAPRPAGDQIALWTDIVPFFLFAIFVPLLGPWEEPGFRGFALSRMQRGRSLVGAGLAVGVIHVFWHLPLFFTGDIPAADIVFIMAAAVVFAWLVVGTGGSVLLAMVMHAANNAISGEYITPMFAGSDASTLGWIRALIWCGYAAAVVLVLWRRPDDHPVDRTTAPADVTSNTVHVRAG